MTERKQKNREEIESYIEEHKNYLHANESYLITLLANQQTPDNSLKRRNTDNPMSNNESADCFNAGGSIKPTGSPNKKNVNSSAGPAFQGQDVASYLTTLKKLQSSLEQKNYVMEVDYEKQRLNYQNQIQLLSVDLQQKKKELQRRNDTITVLSQQVRALEQNLQQKQMDITELNQELAHYRRQNAQIKLENKKYKADNKILMNHIDRLTHPSQQQKETLEEREMRVMKSLYQDSLPSIEERESRKKYQFANNLTNKILLDDTTDRNGELKSLIRRLNQEIDLLKREKALLIQENKQKTLNLQKQKEIVSMSQQQNQRLKSVLGKMGEKVMSLQNINQTLKQSLLRYEQGQRQADENYYRHLRIKTGQFYYKK